MALTTVNSSGIKDDSLVNADIKSDAAIAFSKLASTPAVLTGSTNNTITTVTAANAIQGEANLTFDGSTLKLLNASVPQIRINNDTSDGSSTRFSIGKATASNNFFNGAADGDSCISAPSNLLLGVGASEKLRIDSSGKVGIGTTSPSKILDVEAAAGGNYIAHFRNGTSATPYTVQIEEPNSPTAGYPLLNVCSDGGTTQYFRVDSGRGVTALKMHAGAGIDFSATSDATGKTSELLADYEEGLYQPTIIGSSSGGWGTNSYTYFAYTKIGRVVFVSGYININADNSADGDVRISLPFTAGSFTENADSGSLTVSLRAHNDYTSLYNVSGVVLAGQANMEIVSVRSNGTHVWVGQEHCDASWNVRVGGFYFTA